MTIHLHIERLILDGLPNQKEQSPLVQAALERELTRLLGTDGLGQELRAGRSASQVHASGIELADQTHPTWLGQQIAQRVYHSIGGMK